MQVTIEDELEEEFREAAKLMKMSLSAAAEEAIRLWLVYIKVKKKYTYNLSN